LRLLDCRQFSRAAALLGKVKARTWAPASLPLSTKTKI